MGPVWQGGNASEAELLASCYKNSLSLAASLGATSLAFPAISCGVYGYPPVLAAEIAVREVAAFLAAGSSVAQVVLVAFDSGLGDVLRRAVRTQGAA